MYGTRRAPARSVHAGDVAGTVCGVQQRLFDDPAADGPAGAGTGAPAPTAGASGCRVVHCRRAPAGSFVYIGRPSPFGNPFPLAPGASDTERAAVIARYAGWFIRRVCTDDEFAAAVEALRGRDLGCWCKTARRPDRPCHGDVIVAWLDAHPPRR